MNTKAGERIADHRWGPEKQRRQSEFLRVAETILETVKRPLSPRQIVDLARDSALFSDRIAGKTPHQTMKSKLSVNIRTNGVKSPFVRTAPGRFYLRRLSTDFNVYEARPSRPPDPDERVLVFPSSALDAFGRFQGISRAHDLISAALLNTSVCTYLDRYEAENDIRYKQVLTYINVVRNGEVLSFKRGTYNRVAEFLRGSRCIGFGGHVTEADYTLFDQTAMGIRSSVLRELGEELKLPRGDAVRLSEGEGLRLVGVLNDDSSAVGQKHIAFIYQYETQDDPVWDHPERGEKAITQLGWWTPDLAADSLWDFEYWSQLCLRELFPISERIAASHRIHRKSGFRSAHVLCVVGSVGSGKSEATRVLTEDHGYVEVNTGRVVAELLGIPPIPWTPREEFQSLAWKFINTESGPQTLASAIRDHISAMASQRILVDGFRQTETLARFRALTREMPVCLLYVHTPPDVAYQFYRARERDVSFFDYLKLRNSPVEKEVAGMINDADAVVYNWTGKSGFRAAISSMMQELLGHA